LKEKHGISIVLATHDLDFAARIADRICIVKGGSVIAEGRPSEIFYNSNLLEDAGLKEPNVVQVYKAICEFKRTESKKMEHPLTEHPVTVEELVRSL
jgi:cobalt/nickel transport system ATP-binding protein